MTHYANATLLLARKPAEPPGKNIAGNPVILLPDLEGSEAQGKAGGHVACPQLLLLGLMCGELAPFPTLRHSACSGA